MRDKRGDQRDGQRNVDKQPDFEQRTYAQGPANLGELFGTFLKQGMDAGGGIGILPDGSQRAGSGAAWVTAGQARQRAAREGFLCKRGDHQIGKVWCRGPSVMHSYFRNTEATADCLVPDEDGKGAWLDTGDMGYTANGYLFIVGRAKDMIIINGKNHWPQDVEWAVEQLPGFNHGDIAAFSIEMENGEEAPAVLVHCRVSDPVERVRLREQIADKVRSVTGMSCIVELVPPRTLPRTSSGKLSRAKAKKLYLAGEIVPISLAA